MFKYIAMIKNKISFFIILLSIELILVSCSRDPEVICPKIKGPEPIGNLKNICFGSCSKESKDQPILDTIVKENTDIFIYLGDNIYGDTKDMTVLKAKYNKLGCKPEFQRLYESCKVLATWDDHDYGVNDGGKYYSKKAESKEIFLDFWEEPLYSERRNHTGIYHSEYYGDASHLVQIILLDCRTFRDDLKGNLFGGYDELLDSNATMLGVEQWNWLRNELLKPATFRIICSSTQFSRTHVGYEAWANMPYEKEKMKNLIKDTRANGVVFISGDIHLAELSKQDNDGAYPIYDMTSSGITQLEDSNPTNGNRIGQMYKSYNYGKLEFDWSSPDPEIILKAKNIYGNSVIEKRISLSEISF